MMINLYQYGVYQKNTGNGVNDFLYRTAQLLKHDIQIHFINFDLDDVQGYQHRVVEENIHIHTFAKIKYRLYFPPKFKQWLKEISLTNSVFNVHSVFRLENFRIVQLLIKHQIPCIFTPHDSYSPESLKKKQLLKMLLLYTTERYILNHVNLIHAITEVGSIHIQNYTNHTIRVVPNFIADPRSASSVRHQLSIQKNICFIGRFDIYQKGLDLSLKAFRLFLKNHSSSISLNLIGPYKKTELVSVHKMSAKLGLQLDRQLVILGFLEELEKQKVLSESYVYMQLSRYEGFSYSVAEALAFGKPMVITDKIPISNYVRRYNAGVVVSTAVEASKALAYIYSLPEESYEEMCMNARKCYEENFHADVVKPLLIDMYQSIF